MQSGFYHINGFHRPKKKRKHLGKITATNRSRIDQFRNLSGSVENKDRKKKNSTTQKGILNLATVTRAKEVFIERFRNGVACVCMYLCVCVLSSWSSSSTSLTV